MAPNVFHFADSVLPLWVTTVAKNELVDSKEPGQDEQSNLTAEGEDSLLSRKLAEMMAILLKKGSPRILDCASGVLLSTFQLTLRRSDYDIVLGMTRFICDKLLGNNSLALEKLVYRAFSSW